LSRVRTTFKLEASNATMEEFVLKWRQYGPTHPRDAGCSRRED